MIEFGVLVAVVVVLEALVLEEAAFGFAFTHDIAQEVLRALPARRQGARLDAGDAALGVRLAVKDRRVTHPPRLPRGKHHQPRPNWEPHSLLYRESRYISGL